MESSLSGKRQIQSEMKILLGHHKTTITTPIQHNVNNLANLGKEVIIIEFSCLSLVYIFIFFSLYHHIVSSSDLHSSTIFLQLSVQS